MTPELWKILIGAVALVLTTGAGLLKVWTEIAKIKAERLQTRLARDADSQDLHDQVLKHGFLIQQLKDQQALTATVVDDLRDTCNTLNANIVKLDVNVANLADAIKELRK